ncbi:MAG: hypothetical protein IH840_07740 [Candidatus Heimdallarchaeota archaeon]|nr:hypothetical protein [Candidatus Heimdallarchaeota archaeon]
MEKSSLVVGSIGFDHIISIIPSFKQELPLDNGELNKVNMTFVSSTDTKIIYGGTGSNIAYSHALINSNVLLFSAVGNDFKSTMGRELATMGVDDRTVVFDRDTARSLQITDSAGEQMIVWQPNAYEHIGELSLNETISSTEIEHCDQAIFSPGTPQSTIKHLKNYRVANDNGIAYFDPGQMVNHYSKEIFEECCKLSNVILANEVEMSKIEKAFGFSIPDLQHNLDLDVIITLGDAGSKILTANEVIHVISYTEGIDDSITLEGTGAGDAYRGALLGARNHGLDLVEAAKVGSVIGGLCVRHPGGQLHKINWEHAKELAQKL